VTPQGCGKHAARLLVGADALRHHIGLRVARTLAPDDNMPRQRSIADALDLATELAW
jgi:hypothetical protein